MDLPVDRESLEILRTSLLNRRNKLEDTNAVLDEQIQAQNGTHEELRTIFEIRLENLSYIEQVDQMLQLVKARIGE